MLKLAQINLIIVPQIFGYFLIWKFLFSFGDVLVAGRFLCDAWTGRVLAQPTVNVVETLLYAKTA